MFQGINISHPVQYGETALHNACGNGLVDVAAELLKHGARIDLKSNVRLWFVGL